MTQKHSDRMRRLVASGLLPERAGQPVRAWVHLSLADLLLLDGDSALQEQWTAQVRERWAACRAFASETGSEGGAWLDGDAAEGAACDAAMAPVVTGDVNIEALEDLVRLCAELDRHRRAGGDAAGRPDTTAAPGTPAAPGTTAAPGTPAAPGSAAAWAALEQAVIGKAVDLLSGPGGLASFLRRRQLGVRLGGPSLPLDIGYAESIPAGIRNAVTLRDRTCRFPGGCNQPASACDVHHVTHKKYGGKTSVKDCVLLCFFHHQVVIHQQGWTLVLEPGRHHHRVEQGQDEGAAQPRPARPGRVTAPARPGATGTTTARRSRQPRSQDPMTTAPANPGHGVVPDRASGTSCPACRPRGI